MRRPLTNLDTKILELSRQDIMTFRQMLAGGMLFLGDSGAGKSSSLSRECICGALRQGMGATFCTNKPGDTANYVKWAHESGFGHNVVVFNEQSGLSYDCLAAEFSRTLGARGAGNVESIIEFFDVLLSIGKPETTSGENRIWEVFAQDGMRVAIHLLKLAGEPLSIENIHKALSSFPQSPADNDDPAWQKNSYTALLLFEIERRQESLTPEEWENLKAIARYLFQEWANLADKTRGSIVLTFGSLANKFLFNPIKRMFASGRCDFRADQVTHEGLILILDFPGNEYGREVSRLLQTMVKISFQRNWLRHTFSPGCCNGAILVQDEFQTLIHKQEAAFSAQSRASAVAPIYLTQTINNLAAELGETQAGSRTFAFLNNVTNKAIHRSTCPDTTKYFSDVVGKAYRQISNFNAGSNGSSEGHVSVGGSSQLVPLLDAFRITQLARPSDSSLFSDAFIFCGGDNFIATQTESNPRGSNFLKVHCPCK